MTLKNKRPDGFSGPFAASHGYSVGVRCMRCGTRVKPGEYVYSRGPASTTVSLHLYCAAKDEGDSIVRERVEVQSTPPVKLWTIPGTGVTTPTATVGFGRATAGQRGIRLELAMRLAHSLSEHKDRRVVARKLRPEKAIELGQALIEAGEQALKGDTPTTKRSDER